MGNKSRYSKLLKSGLITDPNLGIEATHNAYGYGYSEALKGHHWYDHSKDFKWLDKSVEDVKRLTALTKPIKSRSTETLANTTRYRQRAGSNVIEFVKKG